MTISQGTTTETIGACSCQPVHCCIIFLYHEKNFLKAKAFFALHVQQGIYSEMLASLRLWEVYIIFRSLHFGAQSIEIIKAVQVIPRRTASSYSGLFVERPAAKANICFTERPLLHRTAHFSFNFFYSKFLENWNNWKLFIEHDYFNTFSVKEK